MCARSHSTRVTALFTLTVVWWAAHSTVVAGQAQAPEDRILGTWTLNVGKSKYSPGPPPKTQRRTYIAHPEGVKTTIVTVFADGKSTNVEFVTDYNSIEHPVTGSAGSDMIRMKRINDETAEAVLSHAGMVIGVARRVIARDGRSMTITFEGKDSRGFVIKSVSVYDKEP